MTEERSAASEPPAIDMPGVRWVRLIAEGARGALWLAEGPDGRPLAAKQVRVSRPLARARLARAMQQLIDSSLAGLAPVIAVRPDKESVWIFRAWDDGVPVGKLSDVASLRAVAAAQLAHGVLLALAAVHDEGMVHGGVHSGNVFIERDGTVRLTDAGIATAVARRGRPSAQKDVAAVATMLRELWRPMRGATSPPLAQLITSGALQHAPTAAAALRLVDACIPGTPEEADSLSLIAERLLPAAEAEAPVAAVSPAAEPEAPVAAVSPAAEPEAPVVADSPDAEPDAVTAARRARSPVRPPWPVLAAAAVLLIAVGTTLGITRPWNHPSLASAPAPPAVSTPTVRPVTFAPVATPTATPTPAPTPSPHPPGTFGLQPPAPPTSGIITDAEWSSSNGPCPLGFPCNIYSWLDLSAHSGQAVAWDVVAVDQCTGAQTVLFSVAATAASTASTVSDSRTVSLPGTDPLVVYTVAQVPARVASPPLAITPAGMQCAG